MAMKMVAIGDQVLLHCNAGALAAVVRDVRRAAGRSTTAVAVRLVHNVPIRELQAGEAVRLKDAAGTTWRGYIGGSNQQSVGVLVHDAPEDQSVDAPAVRAELFWRATLAKRFEMFHVMLSSVNKMAELHCDLTSEEVEFLISCYKAVAQKFCNVLRTVSSLSSEYLAPETVVEEFTETVKFLLEKYCSECITLLEDHLLPYASVENKGRYYTFIGDLAMVSYKSSCGVQNELLAKSVGAYEIGLDTMKNGNFPPDNVTLLGLVLTLSSVLHDEMNCPRRACTIALEAVAAISAESPSAESMELLKLIQENVQTWSEQIDHRVKEEDQNATEAALADGAINENQEDQNATEPALADGAINENQEEVEDNHVEGGLHVEEIADQDVNLNDQMEVVLPAQEDGDQEADVELNHQMDVEDGDQAGIHQNMEENHEEEGLLLVQENDNIVPMDHFVPFEEPSEHVDVRGNTYHGKNNRRDRKKRAAERSRYE